MARKKGKGPDQGESSHTDRTAPEWMDANGELGALTVLLMEPAHRDGKLPNNPFIVARSLKEQVGSITAAYRDKDGNLVIKVRCNKKAAKLLAMTELIDKTKIRITEHARLNQVRCIVTCHSVSELSDEELAAELEDQGVIGVQRLGKKGTRSATMVVTLRGTVVPKDLYFGYDLCRTRAYKQAPMQCYRCFDFGHTKARCSAEELCRNCSSPHKIEKDEEGKTLCKAATSCKHCGGAHSPTSRLCHKFKQEEEINEIRTSEDKSPREARRLYEERKASSNKTSYAAVTNANTAMENAKLKEMLENTKRELKRATDEIAKLKALVTQQSLPPPAQTTTQQTKKTLAPTSSVESIPDSVDMESEGEDARKRRRSSTSSNDSSSDNSEDSQELAPVVNTKTNPAPAKSGTSKPGKTDTPPATKPLKPKISKKQKPGSGQKVSNPNDTNTKRK